MKFRNFIERDGSVYTLRPSEGKTVQDIVDYCANKTAEELKLEIAKVLGIPEAVFMTPVFIDNIAEATKKLHVFMNEDNIEEAIEKFNQDKSIQNIVDLYISMSDYKKFVYVVGYQSNTYSLDFKLKFSSETKAQEKAREASEKEAKEALKAKIEAERPKIEPLENYISQFNNKTNYFDLNTPEHQKLYNAFERLNNGKPIEKDDIEKIKKDETFLNVDSNDIKGRINAIINVCERLHEEKTQKLIDTLLTLFNDGEDKFKAALSNEIHRDNVYALLYFHTDKNTDNKLSKQQQDMLKNDKAFIDKMREDLPEFMQSTVEIKIFKTFAERVREEQKESEESQSRCLIF